MYKKVTIKENDISENRSPPGEFFSLSISTSRILMLILTCRDLKKVSEIKIKITSTICGKRNVPRGFNSEQNTAADLLLITDLSNLRRSDISFYKKSYIF